MSKYFIVDIFKDDEQIDSLKYELYDNIVVDTFIEVLDKTNGMAVPVYHSTTKPSKSQLVDRWVRMWKLSKTIEQCPLYADRINFDIERDKYSQELLNHLHSFVEEYEVFDLSGKMLDEYKAYVGPAISEFNDHIHFFEYDSLEDPGWLGFRMEKENRIEFTPEQIDLGQKDYYKNKLYLGYGEVGKTLRHMFQNNDLDGVKRDQTNPKKSITSEVMMPFKDMRLDYDAYSAWCVDNNAITSNFPWDDKRHWAVWEIGTLIGKDFIQMPFDRVVPRLEIE